MKHSLGYKTFAVAAVAVLALSLSACGEDDNGDDKGSKKSDPTYTSRAFGAACSSVPKTGEGSFEGMSNDPVATAASNNPVLSTLVSAVTKAELGATLNGAQNITVFAPANSAFDKIPAADLQKVLNDPATLKKVLTYHVVGERVTPDKLDGGSFKTLEGGNVTVAGSGTDFTVNGTAKVVCGNVQTANATVYIIDTVLMPAA